MDDSVKKLLEAIRALSPRDRAELQRAWKDMELGELLARLGEERHAYEPPEVLDPNAEAAFTVRVKGGFKDQKNMKRRLISWLHGVADKVTIEEQR